LAISHYHKSGQFVEFSRFEIKQSDKGPQAANLTRLEEGKPMEVEQESSRDDNVLVDDSFNSVPL
jgi:cold shock CspA family protein